MKRAEATARLVRILQTLDTGADLPLDVREVHVFGSYATGAALPRDLDLIIVLRPTSQGREQDLGSLLGRGTSSAQKMNARLKHSNGERIDILYGTSVEQVRSGHTVSDPTILVWCRGEPEEAWRRRIDGIPERPGAGRAPRRESFLDRSRCEAYPSDLEQIEKLLHEGVLSFSVVREADVPSAVHDADRYSLEWGLRPTSKLRPLFDLGLRYIRYRGHEPVLTPWRRPQVWSKGDKIVVDCGRPRVGAVPDSLGLDSRVREWCGIPRPRRGEGLQIWVFRRAARTRQRQ